jgi:putative DNA methylase
LPYKKKLIEVALPLTDINAACQREKTIRHGHPSTLHYWWARRPLAAARAVIWSSLVNDPSSCPEKFPTIEAQELERKRLFDILKSLVVWENSNDVTTLSNAYQEILKSTEGDPPAILDPFAGGGTIPLEAQRLGLKTYASDLNPVSVLINKAMIEIPYQFANFPAVNPTSNGPIQARKGTEGLSEDISYYGNFIRDRALQKIGSLYPKVIDKNGIERTVIAWIWARTVKCPNPACGTQMPLVHSFVLSGKKGKEAFVKPIINGRDITYEVYSGKDAPEGTVNRQGAVCLRCGSPVSFSYIRSEGQAERICSKLMAIVADGDPGRLYLSPDSYHSEVANTSRPNDYPDLEISQNLLSYRTPNYGLTNYADFFSPRQLTALTTFSDLVNNAQEQIKNDGGSNEYARALGLYLSFIVSKEADYCSTICSWHVSGEKIRNTFSRQAIPMVWDYAEVNPFSSSSGSFENMIEWVVKAVKNLPAKAESSVCQRPAQSEAGLRQVVISTDPPYYDNIGYAELSDFFYLWLKRSLKGSFPEHFKTILTPKNDELIANRYRFEGDKSRAVSFFERGMLEAFKKIYAYSRDDIPITVYYAYKQSENGWETMLSAMIEAGFIITGTWPIRTEMPARTRAKNSNALASSIVLVCRKRPIDAPYASRRDFINALKKALKQALTDLEASNIAPVDLFQSSIGPGMRVYSSYSKVMEASGKPVGIGAALEIINQELDLYFSEKDEDLEGGSRFCLELYRLSAFNPINFGEADVLARAKNVSIETLVSQGVLSAEKGQVRLLTRDEMAQKATSAHPLIWLLTQRLTKAMEKDGVQGSAKIAAYVSASLPERAKTLAYRLFTLADSKGWTDEAFAYNSLVISWPAVLNEVESLKKASSVNKAEQNVQKPNTLFDDLKNL